MVGGLGTLCNEYVIEYVKCAHTRPCTNYVQRITLENLSENVMCVGRECVLRIHEVNVFMFMSTF